MNCNAIFSFCGDFTFSKNQNWINKHFKKRFIGKSGFWKNSNKQNFFLLPSIYKINFQNTLIANSHITHSTGKLFFQTLGCCLCSGFMILFLNNFLPPVVFRGHSRPHPILSIHNNFLIITIVSSFRCEKKCVWKK